MEAMCKTRSLHRRISSLAITSQPANRKERRVLEVRKLVSCQVKGASLAIVGVVCLRASQVLLLLKAIGHRARAQVVCSSSSFTSGSPWEAQVSIERKWLRVSLSASPQVAPIYLHAD